MKLVLLGPSGAGKGTQAKNLCCIYKVPHISTGDILRGHIARNTDIGVKIVNIMDTGQLVSDDIVVDLVRERVAQEDCVDGFILDGFPRNLHQAKVLYDMIPDIDRVVYIKLADEVIIKRMSGRFSCPGCGAVFHTQYYPPKRHGLCDCCNDTLIQREDDKESTVLKRLRIYHEMTEPIIAFFGEKQMVMEIDGLGDADEITGQITTKLRRAHGDTN